MLSQQWELLSVSSSVSLSLWQVSDSPGEKSSDTHSAESSSRTGEPKRNAFGSLTMSRTLLFVLILIGVFASTEYAPRVSAQTLMYSESGATGVIPIAASSSAQARLIGTFTPSVNTSVSSVWAQMTINPTSYGNAGSFGVNFATTTNPEVSPTQMLLAGNGTGHGIGTRPATGTYTTITASTSANATLISGHTYGIYIVPDSSASEFLIRAEATNTRYTGYLSVNGSGAELVFTETETRITQIIYPTNQSITPSTVVNFNYEYFYNDDDTQFTQTCIRITDLTAQQELVPTCNDIIATGFTEINQSIGLVSGHEYIWRPTIQGETALNAIIGSSNQFYVVSQPDTTDIQSPFPLPTTDDEAATSTTGNLNRIGNLVFYIIEQKFPFNWASEIGQYVYVLKDRATTSPATFDPVVLDLSSLPVFDDLSVSTTTGTFTYTLFSTTTIAQVSQIEGMQQARTLAGLLLWFLFLTMVMREVMSMFNRGNPE